jgi:hypothetical protein
MRTQSIDTRPEAELVLIGMIRKAPVTRRFELLQSWSYSMIEAGRQYVQQLHPEADEEEVRLLYLERQFGKDVSNRLRTAVQRHHVQVAAVPDFQATLIPLIEVLEQRGIVYALSGSLASSLYGMQRATLQLDLVADLSQEQSEPFIEQLASSYARCEEEVGATNQSTASFDLIHLESLFKVVVSLPEPCVFDQEVLQRAQQLVLVEGERPFRVVAPEDLAALQLKQYSRSGEIADDLWLDLLGVLKVQGTDLDLTLLKRRAIDLEVTDLLEHALIDAGLEGE